MCVCICVYHYPLYASIRTHFACFYLFFFHHFSLSDIRKQKVILPSTNSIIKILFFITFFLISFFIYSFFCSFGNLFFVLVTKMWICIKLNSNFYYGSHFALLLNSIQFISIHFRWSNRYSIQCILHAKILAHSNISNYFFCLFCFLAIWWTTVSHRNYVIEVFFKLTKIRALP